MSDAGVRVALIQVECNDTEGVDDRVNRVLGETDRVIGEADLVVLPELWNTGAFDLASARHHAQPLDGDLVSRMAGIAQRHSTWLHGGSFTERADDGRFFNTSVLFGPDGSLEAVYRKIHVFGYGGEADLMSAGPELVVVNTPLGATGLATCYDLRFPEQFRELTRQGASAFLITSGWPSARIHAWDVLVRARAIEDQAWVIACNQVGLQRGVYLGGHSAVIDPTGDVVSRASTEETVLSATVAPDAVERWRSEFPALGDIVPF